MSEFDSAVPAGPQEPPPPAPDGGRGSLAQRQEELVRALVAGGEVPAGFDPAALGATAHALLHKRAEEVAHRFPRLAHDAGPEYTAKYIAWARTRPKVSTAADAEAFAADHDLPPRPPRRRLRDLFR